MNNIRKLIRKEIKLIYKDKIIIPAIIIILGFLIYGLLDTTSSNDMKLANLNRTSLTISLISANVIALISAALFAVITCFCLSRDRRNRCESILKSSTEYLKIILTRVAALVIYAVFTTILVIIFSLGIQKFILNIDINFGVNVFTYIFVVFGTMIFSILLCSGIYFVTRSMDITFLIFGVMFFSDIASENYLLNWVNYSYAIYSDFAGVNPIGKYIVYSRLFQLGLFLTIFVIGIIFKQKFELSLKKSFFCDYKSRIIGILVVILAISTGILYKNEPYTSNSKEAIDEIEGKYVISQDATVKEVYPVTLIDSKKGKLSCEVKYILSKKPHVKYIEFKRNTGLNVIKTIVNKENAAFFKGEKDDIIKVSVPEGEEVEIYIKYEGTIKNVAPAGFAGYICEESIYLLENSNWLFTPMTKVEEKLKVKGEVKAPKNLTVVTVGVLNNVSENNEYKTWTYEAQLPDFKFGIFAANYKMDKFKAGNVEVEFYYSPKHEEFVKKAAVEKEIRDVVEYYEKVFGEYGFKGYPLKVVETSQYKPGGHSTSNVVTIAEYLFNKEERAIEISTNNPGGYIENRAMEFLAHEIAHQWWGGAVEIKDDKVSFTEGLANYSLYSYYGKVYGKNAEFFLESLWRSMVNNPNKDYFEEKNLYERLPEKTRTEMRIFDKKTSSYYKIPLELAKLEQKGGYDIKGNLANLYKEYKMKSITSEEFFKEMKIAKGAMDLD